MLEANDRAPTPIDPKPRCPACGRRLPEKPETFPELEALLNAAATVYPLFQAGASHDELQAALAPFPGVDLTRIRVLASVAALPQGATAADVCNDVWRAAPGACAPSRLVAVHAHLADLQKIGAVEMGETVESWRLGPIWTLTPDSKAVLMAAPVPG